ncbi:hypothetical protein SCA6_015772 [Theobroma cacao]
MEETERNRENQRTAKLSPKMAYITARRSLATLLSRTVSPASSSSSTLSSRSRFALALLNNAPVFSPEPVKILTRNRTSGSGYSPLNDPSPNWSNRPPKETILLDGCDYEHWLIVLEFPDDPKPSEEEMIDAYVKTLASVVGSEEEAKKRIYSVCTTTYTGFGALISEELSYKFKGLPLVLWVLPDSYHDVPNKDYGGDLFVDGKVIRRPQYTGQVQGPGRFQAQRVRLRGQGERQMRRNQFENATRSDLSPPPSTKH